MKRLALTLVLITGIAVAETTENQLNEDMEDGFLDSTYTYPNIHTHKQLGWDDNTIFTGSSGYTNEATQTIDTSVISELDQLDAINYGVDYYSNYDGTVTLKADFYDEAGLFLDNDGGTYTISTGAWNTLSDTYSDTDYIDDIHTITITIGGVSDRHYNNGTDDIQLRDAYVTYDYSEIPLAEILEDTTLDELIMDLINEGAEIELIEDIVEDVIELEDDEAEDAEESESSETDDEASEETDDEQSDKEESNESGDSSSSNDGSSTNANSGSSVSTTDGALEILELVNSINNNAQASIFTDAVDFSTYTSVSMQDAIELEDNEDWYQNQSFYEDTGMADSDIFVGYNKVKLKDGKFYERDSKFY